MNNAAFKKCQALQPQSCVYTAQGTLTCQGGQSQPNPKQPSHFQSQEALGLSFGVPYFQGSFQPSAGGPGASGAGIVPKST